MNPSISAFRIASWMWLIWLPIVSLPFLYPGVASGQTSDRDGVGKSASQIQKSDPASATDLGLKLLKQAVADLDGREQTAELRQAFYLQMKHRRVDDAMLTMNALLRDPAGKDDWFEATQAIYYGADGDLNQYADLIKLVEHPMLDVSVKQRNYRADSLRSSIIHVLVQTPHIDEAVDYAKAMTFDPATVSTSDELFNPLGLNLCQAWSLILYRHLEEKNFDSALKIAESFADPVVRRRMLKKHASSLKRIESVDHREKMLQLYNEALEESSNQHAEVERDEISEAIGSGDFETAEFMLKSYGSYDDYPVVRNAIKLVDAMYKAGEHDRSNELLATVCRSTNSRSMNSEIAEAMQRANLMDLAIEYFGPLRVNKTLSSPMFTQYHQPLFEMAVKALENEDSDLANRLASAIQEPLWRSATFAELDGNASEDMSDLENEWMEQAIKAAKEIDNESYRNWRFYIMLRYRSPKNIEQKKRFLGFISNPSVQAQLLANWMESKIGSNLLQPQVDQSLQEIVDLDPKELLPVLEGFVYAKDVTNTLKVALIYEHDDEMSAYLFDDVFRFLCSNNVSIDQLIRVINTQSSKHRGRVAFYALENVAQEEKAAFIKLLLPRLPEMDIDLSLTNAMLKELLKSGDAAGIRSILNLDLPDYQFVYDETEFNSWQQQAKDLFEQWNAQKIIDFALTIESPRARAHTYSFAIQQLLRQASAEGRELAPTLEFISNNEDPVLRGHARIVVAKHLLESAED